MISFDEYSWTGNITLKNVFFRKYLTLDRIRTFIFYYLVFWGFFQMKSLNIELTLWTSVVNSEGVLRFMISAWSDSHHPDCSPDTDLDHLAALSQSPKLKLKSRFVPATKPDKILSKSARCHPALLQAVSSASQEEIFLLLITCGSKYKKQLGLIFVKCILSNSVKTIEAVSSKNLYFNILDL